MPATSKRDPLIRSSDQKLQQIFFLSIETGNKKPFIRCLLLLHQVCFELAEIKAYHKMSFRMFIKRLTVICSISSVAIISELVNGSCRQCVANQVQIMYT